jgi:pimeloyl-ACP methyl ester carboxylesterase
MKCLVQGVPVYYKIRGAGRPIVMIHGFTPDHRLMLGCMEPLFTKRDGWRRVYFDLPGMGQTPGPDWLTTSDQMLDLVRQFIDRILPGERYCVAGESYGGYLARGLAARDPERVMGLLLLCTLATANPARRRVPSHEVLEADEKLLAGLSPEERLEFESMNVVLTRSVWKGIRRDVLPGIGASDQPFLDKLWKTGYAFADEAGLGRMEYGKPVLIAVGRQDCVAGYEDAWDLLPCFPHATYAVLDRAGHNLQIEQPAVFEALAAEWLVRVAKGWRGDTPPVTVRKGRMGR